MKNISFKNGIINRRGHNTDDGIGISEDSFRIYSSRSSARGTAKKRTHGREPAGMMITKQLIRNDGGQISIKSEKGKGQALPLHFYAGCNRGTDCRMESVTK